MEAAYIYLAARNQMYVFLYMEAQFWLVRHTHACMYPPHPHRHTKTHTHM